MKRNLFFVLPLLFAFACCEPDDETSTFFVEIKGMHDDQPFVLGQTYENDQGYKFNIEVLRFYISDMVLTRSDGGQERIDFVDYIDFANSHSTANEEGERVASLFELPPGDYTSMHFVIGLDSATNFADPSGYPSSHPLSLYSGAYWTWNTGYIFTKIEGSIDTVPNGNGSLEGGFLYHLGTMPLYREVFIEEDFTLEPGRGLIYKLKLDIDRLFYSDSDTLDAVHDNLTHTTNNFPLAERVTDLFVGAFSKR